jgi:glycosyltransferase involved in cell wall biosynthesis
MKVGMVAPVWVPIPPEGYGGVEWVVHHLVTGLARNGVDVVLAASGDSTTPARRLITSLDAAPGDRMGDPLPELIHAVEAYADDELRACDVIHDHTLAGPVVASGLGLPILHTEHGPILEEVARLAASLRDVKRIAISAAQRDSAPQLDWIAMIHNGIDVDAFPFHAEKGDHLAFLGRMNPDKGVVQAIHLAKRLGRPLRIAAKMRERGEHEYFDREVAPLLGHGIDYLGELGTDDKQKLLGSAAALAFPLQWDEPFGLAMVEALACGTPVLALARGSVPEIIDDGVTGVVASSLDELVERSAVELGRLDPAACRDAATKRFGLDRLVDDHLRLYEEWSAR